MAKPPKSAFINPFVTLQNSLIRVFRNLSILPILSKLLRLSICTAIILDLFFSFPNTVSLPYKRTGTSNGSCKTFAYSSCKPLALNETLAYNLIFYFLMLPPCAFGFVAILVGRVLLIYYSQKIK